MDLLSIRKIPLKRQAYLHADPSDTSMDVEPEDDDERPDDDHVAVNLEQIRQMVSTDRTLNDQV